MNVVYYQNSGMVSINNQSKSKQKFLPYFSRQLLTVVDFNGLFGGFIVNGYSGNGVAHVYGFLERFLVNIPPGGIPAGTGNVNLVVQALQEDLGIGTGTTGADHFGLPGCFDGLD